MASMGRSNGLRRELKTIREESGSNVPSERETFEKMEDEERPTAQRDSKKPKNTASSTLSIYSAEKKKRRRGTCDTIIPLSRWALIKENLFVIMMEMQSKERKKERAIEEANLYAKEAKGWDVAVKVESESDFASAKSDLNGGSGRTAEETQAGKKTEDVSCCGLRRRKRTKAKSERSRNIIVPNTHISCRTKTFQELVAIMQREKQEVTYDDCVREYYQPIIEELGFIGCRKFHIFLWIAITIHVLLKLAFMLDIIGYWIIHRVEFTTQTFTGVILLLHILSFGFSALSYIYATQLGAVRGRTAAFCHLIAILSGISIIIRAIMEILALDYRREIFSSL